MTAAVVLTPIFEADMPAEQHGYHANFGAHTAVPSVRGLLNTGHTKIIEGDLAGYFDTIDTRSCWTRSPSVSRTLGSCI